MGGRLLAGIWGINEDLKKKRKEKWSLKRFEGIGVKYCEFAVGNFAALLRVETKILAQ